MPNLREFGFLIKIPEGDFCYKGFHFLVLKSKPGQATDITSARKFVSFFRDDDRARDDNSMKLCAPQIRRPYEI